MRKRTLAALVSASALVVGGRIAAADTNLIVTQADWGGSQYASGGMQVTNNPNTSPHYQVVTNPGQVPAGQIQQTNYLGLGTYNNATNAILGSTVGPVDSAGEALLYPATSLGGQNFTANGLVNLDNYNPASATGKTPDAQLGTGYSGLTSPTGSVVISAYNATQSGYVTLTTGEMMPALSGTSVASPAAMAFVNALASGTCMSYDITEPGGGTGTQPSYFETTFESFDNNNGGAGFNTSGYMQASLGGTAPAGLASRNINEYGPSTNLTIGNDDPGSFAIQHGTGPGSYYTVYLPYSMGANYASTLTYEQFVLEVNGDPTDEAGNVTISDVHTVSPTWAASGSGLSWNTAGVVNYNESAPNGTPSNGVLTQQGNWVGTVGGYGVPNGSGVNVTFGELETGNASVGLDTTQTVGILNFNTVQWQYTLTPSSTGSSTSGSLVMDNTAGAADAAINDVAGGQASTSYTEYVAVPVSLTSTTDVTVTRSTDVLDITGNITGTGGLTMSGAGTLQLYGTNTYSGGTTVKSGTMLVSSSGGLPANKPVTVNGGLLELASTIAGGNVNLSALTITGGKVQLDTGATLGSQPANPPPASNVNLTSLSISGNGTLDINNNHVIIDYTAGNDPISSIVAWIDSGAHVTAGAATWTGTGITSTAAAANAKSYGIGYADAADPGNPAHLAGGQIEVMYTLLGDANLDGKVNGTDFNILATNFNTGGDSWDQGDFTYDGKVNGSDFNLLAQNFNQGASQAANEAALQAFEVAWGFTTAPISVPEPASTGLLVLGAIGVISRRRRSTKA